MSRLVVVPGIGLLALWCAWSCAAVCLGGGGAAGIGLVRPAVLVALVVVGGVVGARRGRWGAAGVAVAACLAITGWYASLRPSHDRAWAEDQSRIPRVVFDGDTVTVHDARRFRYRSTDDWDAAWTTDTLRLSDVVGVDFGVERFSNVEAVAHTFLSFRFATREPLVVSVEIRKERGESFAPVRGLFKQYELMYVLGDERDLVELRAVHRGDTVYLHPMRATRDQARALLVSVLEGAAALADRPAFYDTLRASCTTVLVRHLREVADPDLDHRIFLPGWSDGLAFERDFIDTRVDFAATRAANDVTARAVAAAGRDDFSSLIRQGRSDSP